MLNTTARRYNETQTQLRRFVILPDDAAYDICTLWIMHSHVREADDTYAFDYTPRIAFLSDGPASGKTVALDKVCQLSARGLRITSPTAPAVTNMISQLNLIPFIDEIDELFGRTSASKSDLRAVLNAGYERGGVVARAGKLSQVFGPVAFAGMGANFANNEALRALRSRTIAIWMRPKEAHEQVEVYRRKFHDAQMASLNKDLAIWGKHNVMDLVMSDPEMPDGTENRDIDLWSPLLAIAELAGEDYAARGRTAIRQYVSSIAPPNAELTETDRLIVALQSVFMGQAELDTKTIVERLFAMPPADGSWHRLWGGNSLTAARGLAAALGTIGVAPVRMRVTDPENGSERQVRGYRFSGIEPYVPAGYELSPATADTDAHCVEDLPEL